MKKILLVMMLALPMALAAQNLKLGHFKSTEILKAMPEYTQAQEAMKKAAATHDEEYKRIVDEYQKNLQEFTAAEKQLPDNIKDRRQKELQDMGQKIQDYQQFAQQDLEATQKKLMEPLVTKINTAIKSVGDTEGMTYIFDLSNTEIPYVNATTAIDLTEKIKAKLK
ncbi:MAG: OmpH family outer membrane protein [Bacteroidaceae bacterium]|nr:OmpH family outer membrane protein [Bacteroidaceae bacterium]MBP9637188.1 OmpH family outer membrane protein [Bacteroidaceae bacterium]